MGLVQYERVSPHVGKITLNDPDSLNAMTESMAQEFRAVIATISAETPRPRALILTGAGRAFSAGGDLNMLKVKTTLDKKTNTERMMWFYESFLSMLDLDIPIVAAINGHAVGAGLCVACSCDIRIVAQGAKLGFTFVKLGLHPGMGATHFLPEVLGTAVARELLLTGRLVEAQDAERAGLVSKVVPVDKILAEAISIAEEISANGPVSIRQLTRSLRNPAGSLRAALEREAACQSDNYAGDEFLEGVQAAIEKRKAKF